MSERPDLLPHELRALGAAALLALILIAAVALSHIGTLFMKRLYALAAAAVLTTAAVGLTGCNTLSAIAQTHQALVPEYKQLDVSIHKELSCGDMAAQVNGLAQLSTAAALQVVHLCEQRDAQAVLKIDPQSARRAVQGILSPKLPVSSALATVLPGS